MVYGDSVSINTNSEEIQSTNETECFSDCETSELIQNQDANSMSSYHTAEKEKWRNLMAFWLLGLTNNYSYVVMLSAAHDILSANYNEDSEFVAPDNQNSSLWADQTKFSNPRDCNTMSTGTVLLADIIPSLVIKSLAPFIPFCIHLRIGGVIALSTLSFVIVGSASNYSLALLGVVFASASSGLGEPSILAYSAFYHEDVVSTWSSGTGGAGIFGSLSYAGLTSLGLSARQSILALLVVPVVMAVSFWIVLEHPSHSRCRCGSFSGRDFSEIYSEMDDAHIELTTNAARRLSFEEKLRILPSLMRFMVPLNLVYFAEYLINQGLSELVYFPREVYWISHDQQYRWYQVLYQVGVFVSRSSVNFVYIERVWITSVLQWINVVIFLSAAIFWWLGSIWLAFILIFWEGLLGGAAYVNTFYRLSKEAIPSQKEFAIQVTSMSDTLGITIAGFLAIPLHNWICSLPLL